LGLVSCDDIWVEDGMKVPTDRGKNFLRADWIAIFVTWNLILILPVLPDINTFAMRRFDMQIAGAKEMQLKRRRRPVFFNTAILAHEGDWRGRHLHIGKTCLLYPTGSDRGHTILLSTGRPVL
jgi:hypothetical protein